MHLLRYLLTGIFMTIFSGITTLAASETAAYTPSGQPSERQAKVSRLANGLCVLVLRDTRFPLVSTRLYVRTGATSESAPEAGISHVLEHMVFKGTTTRPKGAISEEVEAVGGYLNAATSYDYTVYLTDMPDRHWKLGMDVVRDMAFNPALDPDELEREKDVIVAELKREEDDPGNLLFKKLISSTLQDTCYGHPIIGFEQTIRSISAQNLRDYIRLHYQPQNMLLVVVGNISPADVLAEAETQFGRYRNTSTLSGPTPVDPSLLPRSGKASFIVEPGTWNKVYFAAALPVPGSGSYQVTTLDTLAYLLGGDQTSLFYRIFKYERQLVDTINVSNISFSGAGVFLITAELNPDNLGTFWRELTTTFSGLKASHFSAEEIKRARFNLEDSLYRAKETLPGLASKLGYFQFFLGGEQGERNTIEAIRNVDTAALQDALNTWIQPDRLTVAILPPMGTDIPDLGDILAASWKTPVSDEAMPQAADDGPEIIQLGTGRTVVLIPDATLPHVSASLACSGGEALLRPAEQGLAALTAHVLTRGTAQRSAPEIAAFLSDRAASLNATASAKRFTISMTGPARFSSDLFGLFAEVVHNPAFSPAETARGIRDQLAIITASEDQPLPRAFRRMMPFLFPKSVYGYLHLGDSNKIRQYTAEQIRTYWNGQKIRPWVLAVAGQFRRQDVLNFAQSLPEPTAAAVSLPTPQWNEEHALTVPMPNRNQAHLMLVFKTAPDSSPDTPALRLLETTLTGMSGTLFRDMRDRQGLGYTVTALGQQNTDLGMLIFYIGTEPAKLKQAEEGFTKILADLHGSLLPDAELNRGKNQLEGEYYRGVQSLMARAQEAANLTLAGRPLAFTREQIEKSRQVTPEQLKTVIGKYLVPGSEYVVRVLP